MTPATVKGPAIWRGPEVEGQDEWKLILDERETAEVLTALESVNSEGLALADITRENFSLPSLGSKLVSALDDVVEGRGFVLIRGVPTEGLSGEDLERVYWGIGQHLGVPIYQNDAFDYLVHIKDQGLDFNDPEVRGYQTNAELSYHSDSTDIVGLLCVRPSKEGGVSTVVSAGAVYNEAVRRRPDLVEVLESPWWWDRRKKDLSQSFFQCRIFGRAGEDLVSYYGRAHIESASRGDGIPELTDEQIEALDLIDSIANDPEFILNMNFRSGDIQFLNNYKVWHARTDYVDFEEPEKKRLLLRLWLTVRRDLDLPADFEAGGITNRSEAFS